MNRFGRSLIVAAWLTGSAVPAWAQGAAAAPAAAPQPPRLPPADSPVLLRFVELRFPTQGNNSVIEPSTYQYYLQTLPSRPSDGVWVPYNEQSILDDFKRLWATNFLDNLWVEVKDAPYANGVQAKHVIFNMEERQRVKIVDYTGSKKLEQSKIEEKLRDDGVQIRLDSFIDPGLIRRVEGIIRQMFSEKGHEFSKVTHTITEMPGGPKLVHLTFQMDEGPRVRIRSIQFLGNKAISPGALRRQMKSNKQLHFLSFITGRGTYQAAKFEEDADLVTEYYRAKGYVTARVGQPELKYLQDSKDAKTRYVQLRIPVQEGSRYRVGEFAFDGNTVLKPEALRDIFKVKSGDYYDEKKIRKSLDKARELYGSVGYFEFTAYPDLKPRDVPSADAPDEAAKPAPTPAPEEAAKPAPTPAAAATPAPPATSKPAGSAVANAKPGPPIVDVTMRMQEGKQYFVNRITFTGNTTTRDPVIRREVRLYEGGVFNTEALKMSIKRLNQLGYFKQLEGGKDMSVDKTPGADNKVDVKLKLEEQNRNQINFGAGVSQYEGVFGQLSFQTANFMGRGETLTLSLQQGSRAKMYQLAFTEPFLFDRPITAGFDVFKRELKYVGVYTEASTGMNLVGGFQLRDYTRAFMNYSLERIQIKDLNQAYFLKTLPMFTLDTTQTTPGYTSTGYAPATYGQLTASELTASNPYLADSLLLGQGGRRTVSKITPSVVYNTVDNPIFPNTGRRYTLALDLAGLGGDTSFFKPTLEAVAYFQHTKRTSVGLRAQYINIRPLGSTKSLPIFERLFLGGEYSVRGFDLRSIGPRDAASNLVLGGNSSLLVNAEYLISIAGPVRLVFFYDAGQIQAEKQRLKFSDFKTSTGAEIRFFMPVLNVPFRLIFAYNPQRKGVLDNQLLPQKAFTFRFAVGSTF
jgi:outer membrane protein insertion porin family